MLPGTAQAWIEAITHGRAWDEERDRPRVRGAFVILSNTMRRWPAPVEFLEALPAPDQQRALTKQAIPADPVRAAAAISEIRRALSGKDAAAEQGVAS